jgi:glucokinase
LKNKKRDSFCGGIDVGGTKISSALFTEDGTMTGRKKVPIEKGPAEKPAQQIIRIIQKLAAVARKKNGEILAIGICIPGVVFQKSGLVWAPNISGWDHYPLRDRLRQRTRIPIVLDSDRSAYVLGEQWCGVAKNKKDVVFLAVGTGIGAGILAGGRLLQGSEDIAGAVGWFALDPHFRNEYAAMGCFEAEASGASIGRKARQLLKAGAPSHMKGSIKGKIENITAETVVSAARAGDRLACYLIDSAVTYLSMGIANIVSILNPDMIVLGGGLFQAGDLLLKPIRKEFKRWAQPLAVKKVKIELSLLGENTGLYGAGKLAWNSARQSR